MKNASLVDVFRYIRQNSDYTFVYDSDAVKQMKTVSLDMKNVAIEEILEQCFKGSPFVYLIEGNLVIIKEQKGEQQQAKSVRVKGFVYDTKKQPMPGVTVKVVGLPVGTATTVVNVADCANVNMGFCSFEFFLCHWDFLLLFARKDIPAL